MARPFRPPRAVSVARHHADWLRLLEISGPFLSMPVLIRAFPLGLPKSETDSELRRRFRKALQDWEAESRTDPSAHRRFIRLVLDEVLEWPAELVKEGQALPPGLECRVAEHGETLRPDLAVLNPGGRPAAGRARVLVLSYPPDQELERAVPGHRWKASPATRAMELCHAVEVPLALVTNGEEWTLVHARRGETTTYATFNAALFGEEPTLFQAFQALLGAQRLFGVADADTLEGLLAESAQDQQEVTDQLGLQVRHAVELLVQAVDRNADPAVVSGLEPRELYEASVAVMMRLVFLLAAEERKLLLLGDPLYDAHYAISTLYGQLEEVAAKHGEELLDRRFAAWARLLATFRAVHGGVDHDRLRLPAYGGSLFDPDRYPFLEGRAAGTSWREVEANPLPVSDRTVFHLLRSLQLLDLPVPGGGREARRLSFRALDVEQIGHVYEGLLDHTAVRATEPVLGLAGKKGLDPELALSRLEEAKARGQAGLLELLGEETGRSSAALQKAVNEPLEEDLESAGRLLIACDGDESLARSVRPWARLLRTDDQDYPLVIRRGSVYVTSGSDRRSTGTHYTPRSLTEPVVQYALEPLVYQGPAEGWPRDRWVLRPARQLLGLRVCDMAMGSGAFLAQTCRWLGERLVESWELAESAAGGALVVTPEGDLATGAPGERPLPRSTEERIAIARRAVAERCLYGVDVNPMAVEMAKLSLWLVTLQKDRPFTFVDHALRPGDSLLGVTSPEQIASFHLDPEKGMELHQTLFAWTAVCEPALAGALEKRRKLESFTVESARDAEEKERLLAEANQALGDVRLVADAVVAAALATASRGEQAYGDQLEGLSPMVAAALDPKARPEARAAARAELASRVDGLMNAGKPVKATRRRPFHWAIEFPEVFTGAAEGRGFDAFVGNPPFIGGQKITGTLGTDFRDHCVERLAGGQRGSADLCAYFFLRAAGLLRGGGTFGLLATNTIAQGDTREVGLDQLAAEGVALYRAVPSRKWPGTANLEVAHVWGRRGEWKGESVLEEKPVAGITPYLSIPGAVEGKPYRLRANEGKSFQGSIVLGMGFVMTPEEAQSLIEKDSRNKEALFPYLNGEDLNSRPDQSPSRWVINFKDWPLDRESAPDGYDGPVARDYPDLIAIVEEKVKPERDRNTRPVRRERWWQFAERAVELYAAIAGSRQVLARARIANVHAIAWVPTSWILNEKTVAFPGGNLLVLQSAVHEAWARQYSSSLRRDMQYTPSDCFDTFPHPSEAIGVSDLDVAYCQCRAALMRANGEGLTKTYGRLNRKAEVSSGVKQLRELQWRMDCAGAAAYGWTDLDLGHGFHETKQGIRFTISATARREVLARLLALNHERYAEEVAQRLHEPGKKGKGGKKPPPKNPSGGGGQGSLFSAG